MAEYAPFASFWGLRLTKGFRYSRTAAHPFHISCATLDLNSGYEKGIISVLFEDDGEEFLLCNLSSEKNILQVPLDLQFSEGDKVIFSLRGPVADVFLTGYNMTEYEDISVDDESIGVKDEDEKETAQMVKRKRESLENEGTKCKTVHKRMKVDDTIEMRLKAYEQQQLLAKARLQTKKEDQKSTKSTTKVNDNSLKNKGKTPDKKSNAVKTLSDLMNGKDESSEGEDDDDFDVEEEEEDDSDDGEEEEEEEEDDEEDDEEDESEDEDAGKKMSMTPKKPFSSPLASPGRTPMVKDKKLKQQQEQRQTPQQEQRQTPKQQQKQRQTPQQQQQKQRQSPSQNKTPKGEKPNTPIAGNESSVEKRKRNRKRKSKSLSEDSPKTPISLKTTTSTTPQSGGKKVMKSGGVIYEDIVMGTGAEAKSGRMVGVYYEGSLKGGKVFDKTTSGTPFQFRLGSNEVIKGWDVALQGMKVGGKRRIITPPAMAYGKGGVPPTIPPNAVLNFEVELKAVK